MQWEAQIGFFEKWPSPSWGAVLGQTGFFDRFTITMSRQATMLAVQDWDEFDQRFGVPIAPPG